MRVTFESICRQKRQFPVSSYGNKQPEWPSHLPHSISVLQRENCQHALFGQPCNLLQNSSAMWVMLEQTWNLIHVNLRPKIIHIIPARQSNIRHGKRGNTNQCWKPQLEFLVVHWLCKTTVIWPQMVILLEADMMWELQISWIRQESCCWRATYGNHLLELQVSSAEKAMFDGHQAAVYKGRDKDLWEYSIKTTSCFEKEWHFTLLFLKISQKALPSASQARKMDRWIPTSRNLFLFNKGWKKEVASTSMNPPLGSVAERYWIHCTVRV